MGRPTVYDCMPDDLKCHGPWHACGRLDLNTSGLLLVTNDGLLVHHVTNPDANAGLTKVTKTYRALCMGILSDDQIKRLRDGVDIKGGAISRF